MICTWFRIRWVLPASALILSREARFDSFESGSPQLVVVSPVQATPGQAERHATSVSLSQKICSRYWSSVERAMTGSKSWR
ncbi:MAG: hypothetical protein FJ104_07845 [Deltaproteobacteria bacterium]|nr:hypothetical protein [Deltaproteobacteria bacterium]